MTRFYLRTSDVARQAGVSEFLVRSAARKRLIPTEKDSKNCDLFSDEAPAILRLNQTARRNLTEQRRAR